ncbi:hypothetical protein PPL_07323 [Heterostelium album PN500]|uniref:Tc1-like transposase DDE domain-containing protein n=1 Tax=Heterostelium pallidum (strain ATCC 26659 / Pp 5 / PN500) TaxID=670386 RepID=D3BF06_HETP5|nr:hypothetical protein PPL_07323 [Heterostelium album PN500]EFA80487.1 hypothetical protein PPL_07323 [Heterostelium album PN500]|eukprot:XP_020432607.1 hypothetical protein PPL_07323 [Heterostelium album PN500]
MSITEILRKRIVDSFNRGDSQAQIGRTFGVSRGTVVNRIKRFEQIESLKDRVRTGRPRIFSDRIRRAIVRFLLIRECMTVPQVQQFQDNCPVHTANNVVNFMRARRLKNLFIPAYSPDINIIEKLWGIVKKITYIFEYILLCTYS